MNLVPVLCAHFLLSFIEYTVKLDTHWATLDWLAREPPENKGKLCGSLLPCSTWWWWWFDMTENPENRPYGPYGKSKANHQHSGRNLWEVPEEKWRLSLFLRQIDWLVRFVFLLLSVVSSSRREQVFDPKDPREKEKAHTRNIAAAWLEAKLVWRPWICHTANWINDMATRPQTNYWSMTAKRKNKKWESASEWARVLTTKNPRGTLAISILAVRLCQLLLLQILPGSGGVGWWRWTAAEEYACAIIHANTHTHLQKKRNKLKEEKKMNKVLNKLTRSKPTEVDQLFGTFSPWKSYLENGSFFVAVLFLILSALDRAMQKVGSWWKTFSSQNKHF